ncbi:CNTLN [Bugula neritina]|uniref:CNTLN n=1 Tax=Bugula neritina TaxID=10212 RepID=A0A7J7KRL2_BUGNE|nr:CNTLN [Bugula neritina]
MSTFLSSSIGNELTKAISVNGGSVQSLDIGNLDVNRLREENLRLREDLSQCQVDKEFVWSLWKKLQVASPDITEAVALVVEREKQKSEDKDRKVLDILHLKDDRIQKLQKVVEEQSQELSFQNKKKLEIHDEAARHQTDKARLMGELSELAQQFETEKANHQQTNNELLATIDELTSTCEALKSSLNKSNLEVERLNNCLRNLEDATSALQEQNKILQRQLDSSHDKDEKLTDLAKRYQSQLKKITVELKSKSSELDVTRKELSDLWTTHQQCEYNAQQRESVIKQLEELQRNTEKMLLDCEGAHNKHTDNQYQINLKMQDEINYLRKKELDQNDQIHALEKVVALYEEKERDTADLRHHEQNIDVEELTEEKWKTRLFNMEQENEKLKERLYDKNRVIDRLSKRTEFDYITSEKASDGPQSRGKSKHARSKSESGVYFQDHDLLKKLQVTEAKLEQAEIRLQLKESQLDTLKQAHQRRLDRLKNLLTSYKLVREQLKVAEDELGRPPKKRKPKFKRPTKKDLQQEDGQAAWNELRFVKNENKNLLVIKMNMEEQIDDMSVKASEDAANIHTLQIQVDTLEQELTVMRREGRNMSSTPRKQYDEDIAHLHTKLESCKSVIGAQKRRLEEINRDNNVLVEEKRTLKFEINTLKKFLFEKKSEMASLLAEVNRLHRITKSTCNQRRRGRYVTPVGRKYESVLKNSMDHMTNVMAESRSAVLSPDAPDSLVEEGHSASDHADDFCDGTLNESDSVDLPEPADSAASLGELIAHRASRVENAERSCQTSPRLLPALTHTIDNRVDQVLEFQPRIPKVARNVATSTSPPRCKRGRWRRLRPNAFSQVSSLKQRLVSLQMKVKSLTEDKEQTRLKSEELVATCEQLQSEVSSTNTRIISQKVTIQKLESDLSNSSARISELETIVEQSVPRQQADQERRLLEQKVKTATLDLGKRTSELKQVKSELENSKDSVTSLNDRVGRLERDVLQKRTLLEDLRLKLRLAKESAKSDLQLLESKSEELARTKAISEQTKTTMESMKCSIKALTKDRKDHENKCKQMQQELTKKEKQLANCQAKVCELQKEMDNLQETARQQLVDLAAQGENAVGIAQGQLVNAHQLIEKFQLTIKVLSDRLLARQEEFRLERQRQVREEQKRTKKAKNKKAENKALNEAKRRAQEILNLSAYDIEDFLNSDTDSEDEQSFSSYWKKENSKWIKRWEKALTEEDFVNRVSELFMEKVDEISNLAR